ncbi:unnamed protein product [Rotaria sordida]|uniref:Uncharacterized protein n=4 Tax=Rotaria sordida TaxID=392033 RepID=A0A813QFQ6_9BILA|nr:unnamed protein product [Rotaria sordida]CAF3988628.1 unnamed protein product [Rotaria sordida]
MKSARDSDYIPVNTSIDEQTNTLSFKPHITQRLTQLEHPKTSLDHEIFHTLRESYDDRSSPTARSVTSLTNLDYALWLEAGKHAHKPTYAKSLDGKPPINYNIWRNYRHYYTGINNNSTRRVHSQSRLNEEAAFKYPIIIPAPSQLGENHLRQFFEANRKELFQNQSHFRMALVQADNDEKMLRMLSLKSQQRNPPISSDIAEPSRLSNISSMNKPTSASTLRTRRPPPQNSLNVSPEFNPRYKFGSGKKFVMKDNHPSIEKVKFERELKMAISFHRELKRAKEGNEKSLYARHQPV